MRALPMRFTGVDVSARVGRARGAVYGCGRGRGCGCGLWCLDVVRLRGYVVGVDEIVRERWWDELWGRVRV